MRLTDTAGPADAGPDGPTPICPWPYTPVYFDPCTAQPMTPMTELVLGTGQYTYNTDTGTLGDPQLNLSTPTTTVIGSMRVVWTSRFEMTTGSRLRASGTRPLVIVSSSTIDIAGTLDVSSSWGGSMFSVGAGANPSQCPSDPPNAGQMCSNHGGSGGGGGGFGSVGGTGGEGGNGHNCNGDGIPGGPGGPALGSFPSSLRGGCAGRDGSHSDAGTATDRGLGGPGGGAVQLVTRDRLTLSGVIHAGGAGGSHGTADRAGGGGGGSGGMIGLEGTSITLSGVLAANGGGGGGGCDNGAATAGTNGRNNATVAGGGARQGNGSNGGNGGFRDVVAGQSAGIAERGGGGGGGGVGFIRLRASMINNSGTTSPAPTP